MEPDVPLNYSLQIYIITFPEPEEYSRQPSALLLLSFRHSSIYWLLNIRNRVGIEGWKIFSKFHKTNRPISLEQVNPYKLIKPLLLSFHAINLTKRMLTTRLKKRKLQSRKIRLTWDVFIKLEFKNAQINIYNLNQENNLIFA